MRKNKSVNKTGQKKKADFYHDLDNKTTLAGMPSCLGMVIILLVLLVLIFLVFSYLYLFK